MVHLTASLILSALLPLQFSLIMYFVPDIAILPDKHICTYNYHASIICIL